MFQIAYRRLLIADFGGARAVVASMNKPISKPQAAQQRLISHAAVLLEVSANLSHTPQATHVSREKMSPIVAENAECAGLSQRR
jgi:hypothetical protein